MCWENKPVSLHRPLMLDNRISAPQVSKFSWHLSTDPLRDPYFIQSVGLHQPLSFLGFLWPEWENVWSNNTDYTASSLARAWQRRRGLLSWVTFVISSAPLFQEGHTLACPRAAVGGKGSPCTPNSPWCYPSLAHLESREEEVCSSKEYYDLSDQSQIVAVAERSPPP